jgi:hypothetical protein
MRGPFGPMPELYTGELRKVPDWARTAGTIFAHGGRLWRVESVNCHNNTPERGHICWCNLKAPRDPETGSWTCQCPPRLDTWVEYVNALAVGQEATALPPTPCTVHELAESISSYLYQVRRFTPDLLERAFRVA